MSRGASRSSPAPAQIRPRKPSNSLDTRRRWVRISACRWCPITTSRRRKACTGTFVRSPKRSTCRCSSTTFRGARSPISATRRCCAWPRLPGVVGVKDATSDLVRHVDLLRRLPKDKPFALLSGNDDTALAYMLLGGHGVISVTANVAPRAMADMCAAALAGRIAEAREINCAAVAAAYQIVCRSQPDTGQVGARRDGPHRPRAAAAADRARCAASRCGAFGAARSGLPLGESRMSPLFLCSNAWR